MARPLTQSARDRLREQQRREQDLAAGVIAAERRLAAEIARRDAALEQYERRIDLRQDEMAEAVVRYTREPGVGLDRAAIVLGRSRRELAHLVRRHAAAAREEVTS